MRVERPKQANPRTHLENAGTTILLMTSRILICRSEAFWSHFGWLLMRSGDMRSRPSIERYAKDVTRDPVYAMLERRKNWIKLCFLLWLVVFAAGFGAAAISGETPALAAQFAESLVVWGGALRTVIV